MPEPITIDEKSPCFNIQIGRLGSAPPYRATMMATETRLLPKLNGHWTPSDSRVRKPDANRPLYSKSPRKLTASPRKLHLNDTKNSSSPSRRRSDLTIATTGSLLAKKESDITLKRLLALNGSIREDTALTNQHLLLNGYEKLKICGIGVNEKNSPNNSSATKQQLRHKPKDHKRISTKEIISPLMNSLQPQNTQQQHYKKMIERNSFLSMQTATGRQQSRTTLKPTAVARRSSHEEVKQFEKDKEKRITSINDYLRRENARYASDEQSVKKVLFENWLHNIEVKAYNGDGKGRHDSVTSTDCSLSNDDDDDDVDEG